MLKNSTFWAILGIAQSVLVIIDAANNDFDWWSWVCLLVIIPLDALFFYRAREGEKREAETKRQLINIYINPAPGVTEEDAKRTAQSLLHQMNNRW
jgi:hypothetical protein